MLTACGSGGDSAPTVSDIQGTNLYYGASAQFVFSGNNLETLAGSVTRNIPNCVGQTPVYATPAQQVLRCTITAIGNLTVQVLNGAGAVIFPKTFTVPAPQAALVTSMLNA